VLDAALAEPLEVEHQQAAADRELRQEHVDDPDAADHHALHQRTEVVDRVIRNRGIERTHCHWMLPPAGAVRASCAVERGEMTRPPVYYGPVDPSDGELLERWRAGDTRSGEALFERYYDMVERFFLNKVAGSVKDLVQETFMRCVESRERIKDNDRF